MNIFEKGDIVNFKGSRNDYVVIHDYQHDERERRNLVEVVDAQYPGYYPAVVDRSELVLVRHAWVRAS